MSRQRVSGAEREAARRAVTVRVSSTAAPAQELLRVREELRALDVQRARLLSERDRLVKRLRRSGGLTWAQVEELSGCSRPALLKRM